MNKFIPTVFILISLSFSWNCLVFRDSDLDPNSDLNRIFTFLNLDRINSILNTKQAIFLEIEVVPGEGLNSASSLVVAPVAREGSSLARIPTVPENGKFFPATSPNRFEVLLEGQGLYKFQLFFQQSEVSEELGSFELDVFPFSSLQNTPPLNIVGNLEIRILSIARLDNSQGIPFTMLFDQRSIGTFGGVSFRWGGGVKLGDFSQSNPFQFYTTILYTRDGINYGTIVFNEFPAELNFSELIPKTFQLTNGVQIGENVLLLGTRQIFDGLNPIGVENYAITISINNPQNYSVRRINTRQNPAILVNSNKTLFAIGNGILYQESDPINSPSSFVWRYDLDLLVDGSRNFGIDFNNIPELFEIANEAFQVYRGDLVVGEFNGNFIEYIKSNDFNFPSGSNISVQNISDGTSIPGVGPGSRYGLSANSDGILYSVIDNPNNLVSLGYFNSSLPSSPEPIDFSFIGQSTLSANIVDINSYTTRNDNSNHFIEFSCLNNDDEFDTVLIRSDGSSGGQVPPVPLLPNSDPFLKSMDKTCEISGDGLGGLWCIHLDNTGRFFTTRLRSNGTWEEWTRSRPLARIPLR